MGPSDTFSEQERIILGNILRRDPSLALENTVAILRLAAPTSWMKNSLAVFLSESPNGLCSGDSEVPPAAARLIAALVAAGSESFILPKCAKCGLAKNLRHRIPNGRICGACFNRLNLAPCAVCGNERPIAARTEAGPICGSCRRKDPSTHQLCSLCGELGPAAARNGSGIICQRCYERPESLCQRCGRVGRIHSRQGGVAVCDQCYRPPVRKCGVCGNIREIMVRSGTDGTVDICVLCYSPPKVECVKCGRVRKATGISPLGPLCQACWPKHTYICAHCGRTRPAQKLIEDGALCSSCYDRWYRVPCGLCGELCRPYEAGHCASCVLRRRIEGLFATKVGVPEPWRTVVDALVESESPRAILHWLGKSQRRQMLLDLIEGRIELSHEGLNSLGRSKPVDHLQALLVATGVLPEISIEYDRLERWLNEFLSDVPREYVKLVRPFAVWGVFRRLRRKASQGELGENGAKWARLRVRQAVKFLAWLGERGASFDDLRQDLVDLWLASGPTTRYVVRDFIAWGRARHLIGDIRVPLRQVRDASEAMSNDWRWEQVESLLKDDEIALEIRVAGLFSLIFGQHLSRIVRLRASDIQVSDEGVCVAFGNEPLFLPPVLDQLVLQLIERRGHSTVKNSDFLFPGGHPGRAIAVESMRVRLKDVDVVLRPSRNSALMELASQLPAPVLADLLGLHDNTAVEWIRRARGDWNAYAASKAVR